MKTLLALMVALLVGCASDPGDSFLNGSWGGTGLGVTSDQDGAEIRLACGAAEIDAPLLFDHQGQIDVNDVVDEFYAQYPIRFQATMLRGYLDVTLTEFYENGDSEVEKFVLSPGATPDFSGSVCLGSVDLLH
jgi:hypothetical protein